MLTYQPFDPAVHAPVLASIWNAACGPDLAISHRLIEFNSRATASGIQAGQVAVQDNQVVGFVLASALPDDPQVAPPDVGWIDALAVVPASQHAGIGSVLLTWAEDWLISQGCTRSQLGGGGVRPFTPAFPVGLSTAPFFRRRGYANPHDDFIWDVARDLSDYTPPNSVRSIGGEVRPAEPGDESAMLDFLWREFPDRWRLELQEYIRDGERISDYMILQTERGIEGCCRMTFPDSVALMERYFAHRLPQPWGQLGSIGVSADRRGQGYGAALLDGGLRRLRDSGVRGCVIDWTVLLDFYGKFGFKPYRQYATFIKEIT